MQNAHEHGDMSQDASRKSYRMLGLNLLAGVVIMYFGMFAMIWSAGEFIQNINFVYMALIMWAPMSAVMLWTMQDMYPDRLLNLGLYMMFALVFVFSVLGMRHQLLVGDRQFLRSMIPHHSGAILMCKRADLADPEVKALCDGIVRGQQQEIAQMKAILARKREM